MSEYIINPMWFYWINVVDAISIAFAIIFVLAALLSGVAGIMSWIDCCEEDRKRASRVFEVAVIISIITGLLAIFIPGKNVLMEMQIAKYATKQNAQLSIDAIKSAVDYITEKLSTIK